MLYTCIVSILGANESLTTKRMLETSSPLPYRMRLTRRQARRLDYYAELLDPVCYPCSFPRCVSRSTLMREL